MMQRGVFILGIFMACLFCSCGQERVDPQSVTDCFAADYLGLYYVTKDKHVCFVPYSEELAQEYGRQSGILEGITDIVSICAEVDGSLGMLDVLGTYQTTSAIQPEQADRFSGDQDAVSAGTSQIIDTAKEFTGLTNISFFRSTYPIWGMFVHDDGIVTVPGLQNEENRRAVEGWQDVLQLAGGPTNLVGLSRKGDVLFLPNAQYAEIYSQWNRVSAIYGDYATDVFAVTEDGTVLYAGANQWGQGNVNNWTDITFVVPARSFTVGLLADGTVVATGENQYGQCEVSEWRNIVTLDTVAVAGNNGPTVCTVGIDQDGNLLIAGIIHGQLYSGIFKEAAAKDFIGFYEANNL